MTDRMNRLPPQVRSIIACHIKERHPQGVVTTATIMELVRPACPDSISPRELADAIAEEAVEAGIAVHFDHERKSVS